MKATGIQTAQGDNAQGFGRLVREQQDWLYDLAYRLTGDARAASAAVEQTFDLAWRDLPPSERGPVQVSLARIAVRACCAELRRRGGASRALTPPAADPASPDGSRAPVTKPLGRGATEEGIQRCLDRLPLDERTVLVLVDVLGLDYSEAAQVLGKRVSTVSRCLAQGRVCLGELLKAQG